MRENLVRLKVIRLFLGAKPAVLGLVPSSNIRDDEISPERFLQTAVTALPRCEVVCAR